MTIDISLILAIGIPAISGLVWLVRMEGRVNGHDRELKIVREDVAYIRSRIDEAIR